MARTFTCTRLNLRRVRRHKCAEQGETTGHHALSGLFDFRHEEAQGQGALRRQGASSAGAGCVLGGDNRGLVAEAGGGVGLAEYAVQQA